MLLNSKIEAFFKIKNKNTYQIVVFVFVTYKVVAVIFVPEPHNLIGKFKGGKSPPTQVNAQRLSFCQTLKLVRM